MSKGNNYKITNFAYYSFDILNIVRINTLFLPFGTSETGSKIVIDNTCTVNFVGSQGTFSCTAAKCAAALACAVSMRENDI